MVKHVVVRLGAWCAEKVDRSIGWSRLPTALAIPVLVGLRARLVAKNLFNTRPARDEEVSPAAAPANASTARTIDGTYNNLDDPLMGSVGSRFGRNIAPTRTYVEEDARLLDPSPRLISRRLLGRDTFQPATSVNLLAAAWIQFEVHDWLSHGTVDENPWKIPLDGDDQWHEPTMTIKRTPPDPNPDGWGPPTYVTQDTHWWDGSQIYGRTADYANGLRSKEKGRLRIDEDGLAPQDLDAYLDLKGTDGNFWLGLAILHSLFMREHNAICERLAAEYPQYTDQQLYDKARLINAALMAKIHTVDWSPAILAHPTSVFGLRAHWFGVLGERFGQRVGRITDGAALQGIPGSATELHGVPYALTEEFVAVYRMHPLIPDEFVFRSVDDDSVLARHEFPDLTVLQVRERLSELGMDEIFYSFGRSHPGAITLHNFPTSLQSFRRPGEDPIDLAAIDILRERERGVPRYNEFRRLFHMKPVSSFEALTDNPVWARELRQIYGDVERVDLMIGLYAETTPPGFAFSDTAFRVFLTMAARRLEADRFFTRDFRPEVYTQGGIDWVKHNTMRTVLLRHFPSLEPALRGVANPFAPWMPVWPTTTASAEGPN